MTNDELIALTQIIQKAPMSRAEALWVNQFLARQQADIVRAEAEAKAKTEKPKK